MADELDQLIASFRKGNVVAIKQRVVRMLSEAQEYEAERRVREQCIRDVAAWVGVPWESLPLNPEMAWEALHDELEAGRRLQESALNQMERARDVLGELQEGLTDEYAGTGLDDTGLVLKELVDDLSPAIDPETGEGVTQEEIDKLKELTAGLIKVAEALYDLLREE